MLYHSTRSRAHCLNSAEAVIRGLAPDGGLYLPERIPLFDWRACLTMPVTEMSAAILSALLPDIPDMPALVHRAYDGKFETEEITPTLRVGDFTVLELFHGPTSAFKDVALCMLPQLLSAARRCTGEKKPVLILTATSGDTGKAALEGFRDVPGTRICVFYPEGGVSSVQRAQMVTQEGENVNVCAVRGNFDDAQSGVKRIFSACEGRELPFVLSSANSINIGRLAPQIVYYFKAYRDLVSRGTVRIGETVNFSVPTGNFGDILAGYLAKLLGLPVGKLVCASNANCVLTDFLRTGIYDRRRPLLRTSSPSMDILVSSNLERLLYLMSMDTQFVAERMEQLSTDGVYTVPQSLLKKMREEFQAFCCDDATAAKVISDVYRDHGYLCDPHTAAGWYAARAYVDQTGDDRPMVVLSTASAYKFPEAVLSALGVRADADGFAQMEHLAALTGGTIPRNLAALKSLPERHRTVIDPEAMLPYVLGL